MDTDFPVFILQASQSEDDVVEQPANNVRPHAKVLIGIKALRIMRY